MEGLKVDTAEGNNHPPWLAAQGCDTGAHALEKDALLVVFQPPRVEALVVLVLLAGNWHCERTCRSCALSRSEITQPGCSSAPGLLVSSEQLPMAPCPARKNSCLCLQRACRDAAVNASWSVWARVSQSRQGFPALCVSGCNTVLQAATACSPQHASFQKRFGVRVGLILLSM